MLNKIRKFNSLYHVPNFIIHTHKKNRKDRQYTKILKRLLLGYMTSNFFFIFLYFLAF